MSLHCRRPGEKIERDKERRESRQVMIDGLSVRETTGEWREKCDKDRMADKQPEALRVPAEFV